MFRSCSRIKIGLRPVHAWCQGLNSFNGTVIQARTIGNVSAQYADEMFDKWRQDKNSVHPSWDVYFQGGGQGAAPSSGSSGSLNNVDAVKLIHLVRAYQVRGHELADLDPLHLKPKPVIDEMELSRYGFSDSDMDKPVNVNIVSTEFISGVLRSAKTDQNGNTSLREIMNVLKTAYCGTIGYEYMHIPDRAQCNWIRERIERHREQRPKAWRWQALERLAYSERFEAFLANKWNTTKRFGVEGVESLIPGLKCSVDVATQLGVTNVVFGMAHRGRMNVITNVMRKPLERVFKEFAGTSYSTEPNGDWSGTGDVKYHLGASLDRKYADGRSVHMTLLSNPSHLEAVNTVVAGKARAKMHYLQDDGSKVMCVVVHGDAAYAGQGMCYEHMQMSQLPHYKTGGTLHVCANNQVGFTTNPEDSRSTRYSTDLGKTFNCPIFHVNADDVEAVCEVFQLAVEWRMQFRTDVVIDLIGYRRHGHNELDQPMFTQPMQYTQIAKHPTPLTIHMKKLASEKVFSDAELKAMVVKVDEVFHKAYESSKTYPLPPSDWLEGNWEGILAPGGIIPPLVTSVELPTLKKIADSLTNFPKGFTLHKQIQKIMEAKKETLSLGDGIDWGTAEALAFGSMLQEGIHVRLSGEDVQRGTFSHRHAVVHDQITNATYCALNNVAGNKQVITVCNSPLSEYGVLGFDLGYSMESPKQIVLWEAQFGDFVNGAQIIIDQFLSSGESKWLRQSGLVMLLPHGYDGQGPDHSSCRIERFLQQCDEAEDLNHEYSLDSEMQIQLSNWQIVNCTTPANYFHVLRRQVKRSFRKPLIVVSPKNMLRMRECSSSFVELSGDSQFQHVFGEAYPAEIASPEKVRRVLWCSGKIYYELLAARRKGQIKDVAIARLEQVHPFPMKQVKSVCEKYPDAEVVWVQEEPRNMGCWGYVNDRLAMAIHGQKNAGSRNVWPGYVGRPSMASTAEGHGSVHNKNQSKILEMALSDKVISWGHFLH